MTEISGVPAYIPNKLYHAAQALGSVIRTIFLLNWIGSRELRQEVTANTNKIESYNGFSKDGLK